MSIIKELLIVPEKMDDEERRLLPICVATIRIARWEHDDNCCGLNAHYSAAEESIEEQEWFSTVPWALRVEDSNGQYQVRSDLVDEDGFLRNTEETAQLFEAWEETIGHRCFEKGRCGQCSVTDKFEVLQIRVA
jgi:hypothetical protein